MRAMMSSFQAATNRARQEGDIGGSGGGADQRGDVRARTERGGGAQAGTDDEPGREPERNA
jgi:hypothetical protein